MVLLPPLLVVSIIMSSRSGHIGDFNPAYTTQAQPFVSHSRKITNPSSSLRLFDTFRTCPYSDISDVKFVVNFDFPGQIEDYVHRIGRTARGSNATGTSYTFFTKDNAKVSRGQW